MLTREEIATSVWYAMSYFAECGEKLRPGAARAAVNAAMAQPTFERQKEALSGALLAHLVAV